MKFSIEARVPEPVNCPRCAAECKPGNVVSIFWDRSNNTFVATFLCACLNEFTIQTEGGERTKTKSRAVDDQPPIPEATVSPLSEIDGQHLSSQLSSRQGQLDFLRQLRAAEERSGGSNANNTHG